MLGVKYDGEKPQWHLLPFDALEETVKVLTWAAKTKYGPHNWKFVTNPRVRYISALYRHLLKYMMGEKTDADSGLSPLSHALCDLIFLIWHENNYTNFGESVEPEQLLLLYTQNKQAVIELIASRMISNQPQFSQLSEEDHQFHKLVRTLSNFNEADLFHQAEIVGLIKNGR